MIYSRLGPRQACEMVDFKTFSHRGPMGSRRAYQPHMLTISGPRATVMFLGSPINHFHLSPFFLFASDGQNWCSPSGKPIRCVTFHITWDVNVEEIKCRLKKYNKYEYTKTNTVYIPYIRLVCDFMFALEQKTLEGGQNMNNSCLIIIIIMYFDLLLRYLSNEFCVFRIQMI